MGEQRTQKRAPGAPRRREEKNRTEARSKRDVMYPRHTEARPRRALSRPPRREHRSAPKARRGTVVRDGSPEKHRSALEARQALKPHTENTEARSKRDETPSVHTSTGERHADRCSVFRAHSAGHLMAGISGHARPPGGRMTLSTTEVAKWLRPWPARMRVDGRRWDVSVRTLRSCGSLRALWEVDGVQRSVAWWAAKAEEGTCPVDQHEIRSLARSFAFSGGPLTVMVVCREKHMTVVDGNHRLVACYLAGILRRSKLAPSHVGVVARRPGSASETRRSSA